MRNGYAVVFLHRKGSLKPFKRHFANASVLDVVEVDSAGDLAGQVSLSRVETHHSCRASYLLFIVLICYMQ